MARRLKNKTKLKSCSFPAQTMAPEDLHLSQAQPDLKAFLPLSATNISTIESNNSPFQTLKLIN